MARTGKNIKRDTGMGFFAEVAARHAEDMTDVRHEERIRKRDMWKRDLTGRSNDSIDPFYGCDLWDEMVDYAKNFTFPWSGFSNFCYLTTKLIVLHGS